jgi:hypothetical protein
MVEMAVALGGFNLLLLFYKNYRLGQILHHVLEIVAQQLRMVPAGDRV